MSRIGMLPIIKTIVVGVCFYSTVYSTAITVDLPEITTADVATLSTYGRTGEPDLPISYISVLLPPDADLQTVVASAEEITFVESPTRAIVETVVPLKTTDGSVESDSRPNESYRKDQFFPENIVRYAQTGMFRSFKIVDVAVQRAVYHSESGVIRYVAGGRVTVQFEKENTQSAVRSSEFFSSNFDCVRSCVNYESAGKLYSIDQSRAKGYVIAVPSSVKKGLPEFDRFVKLRENEGYTVHVITEEQWGGGVGRTAASNIRKWLTNNLQSKALQYLLIIGDPTEQSQVPMIKGPHSSTDIPLVDYCYADLTGELPADESLAYDKYPELAVGRIPVYGGNLAPANVALAKIIRYITEPVASANSWRKRAFLPLHTFGDAQNGYTFGETLIKDILAPAKWTNFRIYDSHMGILGVDAYPHSYQTTKKHWSEGKFGAMILQSHGMVDYSQNVLSSQVAATLTDKYPTHTFNVSCHNARPAAANNLIYTQFLNAGITSVGSAIQVWYNQQTTGYGTRNGGNDFAYLHLKHLTEGMTAGDALNKARNILPTPKDDKSAYQNLACFILYGCPAVGILTAGVNDQVGVLENSISSSKETAVKVTSNVHGAVLTLNTKGAESAVVAVFTVSGRKLMESVLDVNQPEVRFNNSGNGVYIVKFSSGNREGKSSTGFVKLVF